MEKATIWKPVKGFEDRYEISNDNQFRNKKRGVLITGRVNKGYRTVGLGKYVGERAFHILVAQAFPEICGEWFEGCHVHHRNFDRLDNRPENLVVLSASEHTKLHYETTVPSVFKKGNEERNKAVSKALTGRRAVEKHIPVVQLTKKGEFVKNWECISDVAEIGYSPSNVCMCCRGQLKTAYGFLWRYAVSS